MSRLKQLSLAIKDRIEEIPELKGNVVVFRRYDIESEFEKRMAKTRGKCVIIRLIRGKNIAADKRKVRRQGTFTISLFVTPLLTQKDAKDADQLISEIEDKLQGWWPESIVSNGGYRIGCGDLTFLEDPSYDVSQIIIDAPQIPN